MEHQDRDKFMLLPTEEISKIVSTGGPQVCVFPFNGTRRWFLLEHGRENHADPAQAYIELTSKRYIEMYQMLFEHGLDTVIAPVFGGEILNRGPEYMEQIGYSMSLLAEHPYFLSFYEKYNVRVRFYGDYRKELGGTPYAYLCDLFDNVTKQTLKNNKYRLFYGVFGTDATEAIAKMSVEHHQNTGHIPTRHELIEMYYGEYIEKADIFIGFEKFSVFDYPMLNLGGESLYFTVTPSLYMSESQLRDILYDHVYLRSFQEPDYFKMPAEDFEVMRHFYKINHEKTFGIGNVQGGIWYPKINVAKVEAGKSMNEILDLLKKIGPGQMSSTAYDTAWVARLGEIDPVLSNRAIEWICDNQLSDGSWGAKDIYYYHDRVICTLAAMIALTYRGRRMHDKTQIERGLEALEHVTSGATKGLASDPNGSTVGFEMIAPTLVAEAERLGIIKQQGDRILGRMSQMRAKKIEKLAGLKINRYITPAFSAEMAGLDSQNLLDMENLQESNGSVGNSPSATAFFAMYLKQNDTVAINYLHKWVSSNGGAPDVAPFDIFEPAWILWNISLLSNLDKETISLFQPHLDYLQSHWRDDNGIGHASEYTPRDSDDSGLVFELLSRFNYKVDIKSVLNYEEASYFRCFALESNPSVSANIHVLSALRQAGFDQKHPSVQKVLGFLRSTQLEPGYFLDKWHASPYYATSHAVIACHGYDDDLCGKAIEWIAQNQNADGSWGYYKSTAEETAYAIQALSIWKRSKNSVSSESIERGLDWLDQHANAPYEPLWIGKALYCPQLVVQSAILSAQALAKE